MDQTIIGPEFIESIPIPCLARIQWLHTGVTAPDDAPIDFDDRRTILSQIQWLASDQPTPISRAHAVDSRGG
jgi:hypothetical protein